MSSCAKGEEVTLGTAAFFKGRGDPGALDGSATGLFGTVQIWEGFFAVLRMTYQIRQDNHTAGGIIENYIHHARLAQPALPELLQ